MMNGISSMGVVNPQTCLQKTKSIAFLGGGYKDFPNSDPPFDAPKTEELSFEVQVLVNQQKMLGLLKNIEKNTDKPNHRFIGPG
ncbi:MAG TPA: hypothetical protein DDW90_04070 [Cyanobacteria bacterium UBA9971]|nr:hypothetical protein [Cyanobacteria bacterium UBA9971]